MGPHPERQLDHDRKAVRQEMFAQKAVHGNAFVSARAHESDTIANGGGNYALEPTSADELYESTDVSLLPVTQVDITRLIRVLRHLEIIAKRQSPRIAFKSKGRICFMELSELVAVQAEGNYVSLRHRPHPHLLRESISSIAEKLKPYGFIRIHRSVVVNSSAVEEVQPLPTGEYRLRVKGGMEYMVTRTYKENLRDLAQLWVGPERLSG